MIYYTLIFNTEKEILIHLVLNNDNNMLNIFKYMQLVITL